MQLTSFARDEWRRYVFGLSVHECMCPCIRACVLACARVLEVKVKVTAS